MKELAFSIGGKSIDAPQGVPTGGLTTTGSAILTAFVNLLFTIAVVLALIFLILGGIRWVTSGGDAKGIEAARKQITYAIVGLIITALAFAIVRIVVGLLGGNPNFFL